MRTDHISHRTAHGVCLLLCVAFAAGLALAAGTIDSAALKSESLQRTVQVASPIDSQWWAGQSLTAATAAPYQPGTIDTSYRLGMVGATGLAIRAKYLRGETLTTAAVVYLWGYKNGDWCGLPDVNGSLAITLDDAATDADDGTTNKWTAVSAKVDALGCTHVVATVATAAVSSSAGAVVLELTRF